MFANRRIVNANGLTTRPTSSIANIIGHSSTGTCGTRPFQKPSTPFCFMPMPIIVKKTMIASAPVTYGVPVAV